MTDTKYVAFDLHQATVDAAVVDLGGKLITQALFQTEAYAIRDLLRGLGPIRVAQVIAAIGSPHRFRTKRQLWAYCGFGVITRSGAGYQVKGDKLQRRSRATQTRGLNQDFSRR